MKPDVAKMHETWDSLLIVDRRPTELPPIRFDEILSSVFAIGRFYYYIIDFFDMSISHISEGFVGAHGLNPECLKTINDILSLIHPDDIDFVAKAEKTSLNFMYQHLDPEKLTRYKASYNLRFKTPEGYRLFNHQSLFLTMDENNNFIKSLNIHTDISHLAQANNYKISIIGLAGEPSYLNMDINANDSVTDLKRNLFSKRELQVLQLVAKGLNSQQIAEALFISEATVKTHRKNIVAKSGCKNTTEVIAMGISQGWI